MKILIKRLRIQSRSSSNSGGFFDLPQKEESIRSIQEQMTASDFWDDTTKANKMMRELKYLKSCVEPFADSEKKLSDLVELTEMSRDDEELLKQILTEVEDLEKKVAI